MGAFLVIRALLTVVLAALLAPATLDSEVVPERSDRAVAIVDDDPIMASEVERVIALRLIPLQSGEDETAHRLRVLESLIEIRLQLHEIVRMGLDQETVGDVDARYEAVSRSFSSSSEMLEAMQGVGLDEDGLRRLLAERLMIVAYVEERLGPRIFVTLGDIRRYYDEELVPDHRRRGRRAPPLGDVREDIRRLLRQRRLDQETERWTEELRAEAEILEALDDRAPPPTADR